MGAKAAGVALLLCGSCGCGMSQEAEIRQAIRDRFPDGMRRCLQLSPETVGLHVPAVPGGTLYYPSSGLTSPLHHLFVLYAAPEGEPVPELVADLAKRGVVERAVIQATVDVEVHSLGPQVVSVAGISSHDEVYRHESRVVPVALYRTRSADAAFDYVVRASFGQPPFSPPTFPSRVYGGALPPADQHYRIPTVEPYAVSIVAAACVRETPGRITNIREETAFNGEKLIKADVVLDGQAPDWMRTPAFRRAAFGAATPSTEGSRRTTVVLTVSHGRLRFAREAG